jgi:hypothetical protein
MKFTCMTGSWAALCIATVAYAQPPQRRAADPRAPVQCFVQADGAGLTEAGAAQLCSGASSAAPARCYEAARQELGITEHEGVLLCRMATSLAPARCAIQLDDRGVLDNGSLVSYCAAAGGALVAPSGPGSPECLTQAIDEGLASTGAIRLCRGSASSAPAICYAWGRDNATISDVNLVELCAPVALWLPAVR